MSRTMKRSTLLMTLVLFAAFAVNAQAAEVASWMNNNGPEKVIGSWDSGKILGGLTIGFRFDSQGNYYTFAGMNSNMSALTMSADKRFAGTGSAFDAANMQYTGNGFAYSSPSGGLNGTTGNDPIGGNMAYNGKINLSYDGAGLLTLGFGNLGLTETFTWNIGNTLNGIGITHLGAAAYGTGNESTVGSGTVLDGNGNVFAYVRGQNSDSSYKSAAIGWENTRNAGDYVDGVAKSGYANDPNGEVNPLAGAWSMSFDLGDRNPNDAFSLNNYDYENGATSPYNGAVFLSFWGIAYEAPGGGDGGNSTPEPATLALFGLGLGGLALARRRKK